MLPFDKEELAFRTLVEEMYSLNLTPRDLSTKMTITLPKMGNLLSGM
jgi:hypothetical protein